MKNYLGALVGLIIIVIIGFYVFAPADQAAEPDLSVTEPTIELVDNDTSMEEEKLPEGEQYTLVEESSSLRYDARRIVGNSHQGDVTISDGIIILGENQELVHGAFTIDMTTITESNDNERFLTHLSSEDFFKIEEYPTTTLDIRSFATEADGTSTVTADLTILGITNEITFPADITISDDTISATASFEIDRTRWGIEYDSGSIFQQLGDKAIEDEIKFDLTLELAAQPAE